MRITDLAYEHKPQLEFPTEPGQQGGPIAPPRIKNPWRADLQPARFRKAYFHVEGTGIDSGRRMVVHEFPKKALPYAEDMGRRAYEFTVRGYCISYVRDVDPNGIEGSLLYQRDYRLARNLLSDELVSGEPGKLYLPTFKGREITVMCPRYRLTEEEKLGGYCTFDMTFVELGVAPRAPETDSRDDALKQFEALRNGTVGAIQYGGR